jgi:hypothetical protein
LRVVRPGHLYGRGDLSLVGEVVYVTERKENMNELPGLVVEVFRMPGIEVADGGEEVHEHTSQSQPIG